jgi:hypothetical protein
VRASKRTVPGIHVQTVLILLVTSLLGAPRAAAKNIVVEATPVELYEGKPYRTQVGELEYLGGFELNSREPTFGGLSGLALSPDARLLYAVSDHGYRLTAHLKHDSEGRLTGIDSWVSTPLLTTRGTRARGVYRDAEAIVLDQDGTQLVSFERRHRIRRYAALKGGSGTGPAVAVPTPPELANAPSNGGIEAMTLLRDGTLMVLTEYYENPNGTIKGWLMRDGTASPISYDPRDGFSPTDLATLPNGDVLLLERKFNLAAMAARIRRFRLSDIKPGHKLEGEKIAEIGNPLTVDNFEGLAVRQGPKGGILLYLVSDDNYLPFERTLLLQFRLAR